MTFDALVLLPPGAEPRVGSTPILLCPVLGRTPLGHVLWAARAAGSARISVVSDPLPAWADTPLENVLQETEVDLLRLAAVPSGSAGVCDAARLSAALAGSAADTLLVLDATAALLTSETLCQLVALHNREKAAATRLVMPGAVCAFAAVFDRRRVLPALARHVPGRDVSELFLALVEAGHVTAAAAAEDPTELARVASVAEWSTATAVLRARRNRALLEAGVLVEDPASTWVDVQAEVAPGARLRPGCLIEGQTTVAAGAEIGPFARLCGVSVGPGARVLDHCLLLESTIEEGAVVGPFAHIRPDSRVRRGAKVGNFVELKKTDLGEGSKAPHLSYLGDASIGPRVNVGAGTITCNYDGVHKHPTHIEAGAFIGSDATLVAPVSVGEGAYVGAGSTITKDVPAGALALGRAPQVTKEGWVARRRVLGRRRS